MKILIITVVLLVGTVGIAYRRFRPKSSDRSAADASNNAVDLKSLEQSLSSSRKSGDKEGEGTILYNISRIYQERGEYDTALEYLDQSLGIRQEIGDREGEGATLNSIGRIHGAQGEYAGLKAFYNIS